LAHLLLVGFLFLGLGLYLLFSRSDKPQKATGIISSGLIAEEARERRFRCGII
jgi:hypothetical protein